MLWDSCALGVTARNAMKRPEALTEGRMPSVPTSAPVGSVEMSCVEGGTAFGRRRSVSRR